MRRVPFLAVLVLWSLMGGVVAQETDGIARYRVYVSSELEAQRLGDSPLELFSEQVQLGATDVVVRLDQLVDLWRLGMRYEYISPLPKADGWADQGMERVDYRGQYMRYNPIIEQYEVWRTQNPEIMTRVQIGTSHNGRAIWAYRIFDTRFTGPNHQPVKSLVILGGCHAREWVASSVPMHITQELLTFIKTTRSATRMMSITAVYVIPVQNPDGYEFSWTNDRYWRKNRRNNGSNIYGVDVNRNYATGWGGPGSSGTPSSATYRGPSAFSEPETNSLRLLSLGLPSIRRFIDFHSYGEKMLYAWSYTTEPTAHAQEHHTLGQLMAQAAVGVENHQYDVGQASTSLYIASGTSKDWFYEQFGVLSYTIELRDKGQFGFLLPESQIAATQDEAWQAFRAMLLNL